MVTVVQEAGCHSRKHDELCAGHILFHEAMRFHDLIQMEDSANADLQRTVRDLLRELGRGVRMNSQPPSLDNLIGNRFGRSQ
jgi:hypothetical protein